MKKTLIALGLAAVVLVGASYVLAGPGFGPGNGPRNCPGFGGANLTMEQQTQLTDLHQKHYTEMAPLREKMFALRQDIRSLWADPKSDPTVIQGKEKELTVLRDQMREKAVEFKLEARSSLTPDEISNIGAGCRKGGWGGGRGGRGCN